MSTYSELLANERWIVLRLQILKKHNYTCRNCNNSSYIENNMVLAATKANLFKQVLSILPNDLQIINTYQLQFELNQEIVTTYVNGPLTVLNENGILNGNIYVKSSPSEPAEIQAIQYQQQWIYVRNIHVHHTYYQEGKMPWEYPIDSLHPLCWQCHFKLHEESKVHWLDQFGNIKGLLTNCPRCAGAGWIPTYKHVSDGICFKCHGARYIELIEKN